LAFSSASSAFFCASWACFKIKGNCANLVSLHASNSFGCVSQLLVMVEINVGQVMADSISKHLFALLIANCKAFFH